jgi:hypothetical protein
MLRQLTAVALASTIVLGGCGGGGGDDDEPTLTTITEANAVVVSSVVYQAASALFDVATEGPLGSAVGVATAGSGGTKHIGLVSLAARQLSEAFGRAAGASAAVGARYEETYACSGGGTQTVELNDADDDETLSTGDSATISYAGCVEDGITLNGRIAIGDLVVESEAVYTGKVTFDDFTGSEAGEVVGADGALTLSANETPGQPAVYQISGESLTATYNSDRHRLQDFSGRTTVDEVAGHVTFNLSGRISDSSNDVVVDATTLADFVARVSDDHPSQGRMQMTGDQSSRALLTALSATQVRIQVDANGDGTYETTLPDLSWNELESQPD